MYFTAQPEMMMIKIEHTVLATKFLREKGGNDLAASQRNMKGYLHGHDGNIVRRQSSFDILLKLKSGNSESMCQKRENNEILFNFFHSFSPLMQPVIK